MKWLPLAVARRLYSYVLYEGGRTRRSRDIALAQNYLASAWAREGTDERLLARGIALLKSVDERLPQQMTWDEARLHAARLRMEV